MARIRTIKPEFPHSESMGRISRDARLTFIELWTLADDSGRLRGNSRMLASLLFPYDDDAKDLIEGWLGELERENCVRRYLIDGASYLEICNWLNHQKIDKPTPSKLPQFDESSRIVASPREESSEDLDQDLDREGKGRDRTITVPSEPVEQRRSTAPAVQEIFEHWQRTHATGRAILDTKRRRRITEALKNFTTEQLRNAISGYLNSPHHMGTDPKGSGVKYNDIELFLRDSAHIETGLRHFAHPPRPPPKAESATERLLRLNSDPNDRVIEHEPDQQRALTSW
jgi:hypothetical protein